MANKKTAKKVTKKAPAKAKKPAPVKKVAPKKAAVAKAPAKKKAAPKAAPKKVSASKAKPAKPVKKAAPAKKVAAKKLPAKKAVAPKAPAKKAPVKKAVAKKAPQKKAPVKKAAAKKAIVKKAMPKKAAPAKAAAPKKKAPAKPATKAAASAKKLPAKPVLSKKTGAAPKHFSQKELSYFRVQLQKELDLLQGNLDALAGDNLKMSPLDSSGDLGSYSTHMADHGTDNFDRELALNLVTARQESLYDIEDAIRRVDDGTYGVCEECGFAIELPRLKALPFAKKCLACQSAAEKGRTLYRPFGHTLQQTVASTPSTPAE